MKERGNGLLVPGLDSCVGEGRPLTVWQSLHMRPDLGRHGQANRGLAGRIVDGPRNVLVELLPDLAELVVILLDHGQDAL
jgi:hypothetical protein